MENNKLLGKKISEIRKNLKITQKELAEKLNITPVYLSYLEIGKKIPSMDLLKNLYYLNNEEIVPEETKKLLVLIKRKAKKELSASKLNKLFAEISPEDSSLSTYDILGTLIALDKNDEAKKMIFKTLINIDNPYRKKLLESLYYMLEGNIEISIKLMKEIDVYLIKDK